MDAQIRQRLRWVQMHQATGDAGLVCRRCGISRPTLRKWLRRFEEQGEPGLVSQSKRPQRSPARRICAGLRDQIIEMRTQKNVGARRIQIELRLHGSIELSVTAIQRVLRAAAVKPLRKARRPEAPKRYERPVPGVQVQLDTMKIAAGVYQYTAVDDCSRFRVLGVFARRSGASTLAFLERVVEERPFAIERVQTDRGTEFLAEPVQRWLMARGLKFRPTPPRSPHLNGKVERSQLTDLQEFWARADARAGDIAEQLEHWQFDYNWRRPHGSLAGRTPIDRVAELIERTPLHAEISARYDASRERLQVSHWKADQAQKLAAALIRPDRKESAPRREQL